MAHEQSIGFIIAAANTKIKNKLSKRLEPFNITHEQWALIKHLWDKDGLTQKELSERSLKDQPTTARILDKLEKRGLIIRKANPEDRRSFLIYLTNEGKELKDPIKDLAIQVMDEALIGLSEQDQTNLKNLLKTIINNME